MIQFSKVTVQLLLSGIWNCGGFIWRQWLPPWWPSSIPKTINIWKNSSRFSVTHLKRWKEMTSSCQKFTYFYYSNSFHSFIHCLVSTRRRRVGWILKQKGKSENELQRWTIQGMLPCAKSPDDMWESSGSIAELEFDEDIIHRTIVVQYFNCSLLVEHPAVNHDCNTPNSTLPLHQTMHILHKPGCHQIKI